MLMSLEPQLREVCEDVYAYLQPDGSWFLNNTGFLVNGTGVISVDDMLAYLRFVQDLARRAKAAGLSPLDAARQADLGEFKDLLDAERIVGNLHRAYLELDGAERGAPVDLARALGEMVAYHGGQPLTCHA
jgi:cyclase